MTMSNIRDRAAELERQAWAQLNAEVREQRKAEREAEEAERQAANEAKAAEKAAALTEHQKTMARGAYLGAGGSPEAFEREWPDIVGEMRRQKAARAALGLDGDEKLKRLADIS